ncbi:MAG: hypothetical protein AAGE59_32475 [Cyanobacteria bacterium P01_F01_bin.86]
MWFQSKAKPEQPQLEAKDVWSALQSHRRLDQQQQYILELESRLQRSENWMRTGFLVLSCVCIVAIVTVGWNTYQMHQWRNQIEEAAPQ